MFNQSREWGWLVPKVLVLKARRASGTPGHGTSCNPKATVCVKRERGVCAQIWGRGQGVGFLVTFCVCLSVSLA